MTLPKLSDIKNWDTQIEKEITEKWKGEEKWSFDPKKARKIYSIDTPPPYVNAPIHIGHAVTYCYMDFFARYKRMKGYQVLFPLGLDRNGLPIEVAAEKKYGISPFQASREEFLEACKKLLEESSIESANSFAKLGISFTSYKEGEHIGAIYKTDSEKYRVLTQRTFIELYKKGMVYEDSRISNYDSKLRTTIADSEIERKDVETNLNYVKFKIKGSKETIIIATTRPELLCTSVLIIYNPKDERYKKLNGKVAITPIFGSEVKIIPHQDADPNFGTGLVFMSSSGGDQDAVRFLRKLGIKPVSAVGIDGKMNENAGILQGLKTREAREKIIELIKNEGMLEKQEKIIHNVPISERSGAEIEFVEMPEYYLKQLEIKNDIKKISKEIKFFPEESREILEKWLESISMDWPISRRRFYATPIPLWHAEIDGEKIDAVPQGGEYYQPWKKGSKPPENSEVWRGGKKVGLVSGKEYSNLDWVGEERVFDTWMDSSISELFITGYQQDKEFFKKAYPVSLRPQGKEIVRTWLYYTILRGYLETKKAPFENTWIHQHIVDEKGMKMSKSKGNIINPQELLSEFGAEAIRLWSAVEGDLSRGDLKCSKERIRAEQKTINKIINASKFVSQFEKPKKKPTLTRTDELFCSYINDLSQYADEMYEKYDFYTPMIKLRNFLWEVFASHYLELVKTRTYNEDGKFTKEESQSAKWTLNYLLEKFLTLTHPIIPQITSLIMKELGGKIDQWPEKERVVIKNNEEVIKKIMEFDSEVWKKKRDGGISLRDRISGIEIPLVLKDYEKDLRAAHNL